MNTVRSILYATDFSAQSESAFPMAVALARDYGARLIIAYVMPTPQVAYTMETMAVIELDETAADVRARLEQFDPKDPRISVEFKLSEGDAATEILDMARKTGSDMIVIGTHGRTGLSRVIAGSVAEQVLRHAPCPVLTVRCPASKKVVSAATKREEIAASTPVLS
jgi:nucleotide-binding universal stress UspA family protein